MFVVLQRLPHLVYVRAMYTNRFVQLLTCNVKFLGPIVNIGGHLRVDLLRVVGTFRFWGFIPFREWCLV